MVSPGRGAAEAHLVSGCLRGRPPGTIPPMDLGELGIIQSRILTDGYRPDTKRLNAMVAYARRASRGTLRRKTYRIAHDVLTDATEGEALASIERHAADLEGKGAAEALLDVAADAVTDAIVGYDGYDKALWTTFERAIDAAVRDRAARFRRHARARAAEPARPPSPVEAAEAGKRFKKIKKTVDLRRVPDEVALNFLADIVRAGWKGDADAPPADDALRLLVRTFRGRASAAIDRLAEGFHPDDRKREEKYLQESARDAIVGCVRAWPSGKAGITSAIEKAVERRMEEEVALMRRRLGAVGLAPGEIDPAHGAPREPIPRKERPSVIEIAKQLACEKGRRAIEEIEKNDPERLLSAKEAAVFLGCSQETVYKLVKRKVLKPHSVGRHVKFHRRELLEYTARAHELKGAGKAIQAIVEGEGA